MKRQWLLWALLIAFIWIVVSRLAEIRQLAQILAQGQWGWIALAAIGQCLYYICYTALYQSAFDTVEVQSRLRDLLPVMFASVFVIVAAPSGGASGAALFVDDAARRGQSAARAAAGTLLVLVADFSAFTLILCAGLYFLFRYHDLQAYEIVGALTLLAIIAGLASVLLLGLWRPVWLHKLLTWIQRTVNRLGAWVKRPELMPADWAERNAAEFTEAAQAISAHPRRLGRTLGVALGAHLLDLTSLYLICRAFQQPVGFGVLVAAFSMGILFWVVSITPQGIGVVEGVMTLVLTSLGVPATHATVIALAFRGLSFWLPFVIGFVTLQRVRTFGVTTRARGELGEVRLLAWLTGLMGIVNLLSAATPALAERVALLERFSPLAVRHGGHLTAALSGFALLLLASGLWRRKRLAWALTLGVLVVSAVSHLVKGLDYEEALLAGGLALWLILRRAEFHARSDPPSVRQGVWTLIAAFAFTLTYGTAGFYFMERHFTARFDFFPALRQTVVMFVQFYDPGLEPLTPFGRYFADSIYIVGAVTFGYALLMLLRPVLVRAPASAAERARARAIVEAYGRSSLAAFTLLEDKSYWFSPGGSVVAYVARGRAAVTLGDPIGPAEDFAAAVAGFKAFCAQNDWLPAFYQVLPEGLPVYQAAGFDALCVGDEAVVDLAEFSLEGKEGKKLRKMLHHMEDFGYRTELHSPPIPADLLEQLRETSDEWLDLVHGTEKRFSLGWFYDAYIQACPIMAVHDAGGNVLAFANLLSEYRRNEATIDMMRHRPDLPDGVMEFLFLALFQWAQSQGYATFNLGLSSLTGVGEQPTDPALERGLHYIYEHVNQFYNFQGLHAFKEKFHPHWEPRYLIYPGPASLLPVALAMIRADSGDDFVRDYLGGLFKRPGTS